MIGRDAEVRAVERFVDGEGVAPLLLVGEAGIGKTILWREAVARARARGRTTLTAQPSEAETTLAFAGLADLLSGVPIAIREDLPGPQRHALAVALLEEEAEPLDRRAIGAAFHGVLVSLARRSPVLVAVDDLHWLDPPSLSALLFALRRTGVETVRLLAAQRAGHPVALEGALEPERLILAPLSLGALNQIIERRLGILFPRPTLRRVHEVSGGNPLYAIHLARALDRRGRAPLADLPVSAELTALLSEQLAHLPAHTTRSLVELAAAGIPTHPDDKLDAAIDAGIVEVAEGEAWFAHPLYRSIVYATAPAAVRRSAHIRLGQAAGDVETRARHRALAATGPDAAVAELLDRAAASARTRGAPETAAELSETAARLTPPARRNDAQRRKLQAAAHLLAAGALETTRTTLEGIVSELEPGPMRARALLLLGTVDYLVYGSAAAVDDCERALAEAGGEEQLRGEIHAYLAGLGQETDQLRMLAHAERGVALLEAAPDAAPEAFALALMARAQARVLLGDGLALADLERAIELERRHPQPLSAFRGSFALAMLLKYADRFEEARALFEQERRRAEETGDEASLPQVLGHFAELELWRGDPDAAARLVDECFQLAQQPGGNRNLAVVHFLRAQIAARAGDSERARAEAEVALRLADDPWSSGYALSALGLAALGAEELEAVDRHLSRLAENIAAISMREPALFRFHGDHVEALIGLGHLERAEQVLNLLEPGHQRPLGAWAPAIARRCRGLIAAARGDLDGAIAALEDALRAHDALPVPFERARTLLALGVVRRRAKQRRAAREALEQSVALFEEVRATGWAEKARAELARIPGRARLDADALTPTETRVASLVAQGCSNKEAAARLFVTVNSVERHLSRVYRKLGVHSRSELVRLLSAR